MAVRWKGVIDMPTDSSVASCMAWYVREGRVRLGRDMVWSAINVIT